MYYSSSIVSYVFNSILKSSNSQFPKVHVKQPYRPQGLQALRRRGPVRVILSRAIPGGDRETDRDKDREDGRKDVEDVEDVESCIDKGM